MSRRSAVVCLVLAIAVPASAVPLTFTGNTGRSADTSTTRTLFWAMASTKAVCGTETARSSGFRENRPLTYRLGDKRLGRR